MRKKDKPEPYVNCFDKLKNDPPITPEQYEEFGFERFEPQPTIKLPSITDIGRDKSSLFAGMLHISSGIGIYLLGIVVSVYPVAMLSLPWWVDIIIIFALSFDSSGAFALPVWIWSIIQNSLLPIDWMTVVLYVLFAVVYIIPLIHLFLSAELWEYKLRRKNRK